MWWPPTNGQLMASPIQLLASPSKKQLKWLSQVKWPFSGQTLNHRLYRYVCQLDVEGLSPVKCDYLTKLLRKQNIFVLLLLLLSLIILHIHFQSSTLIRVLCVIWRAVSEDFEEVSVRSFIFYHTHSWRATIGASPLELYHSVFFEISHGSLSFG